MGIVVLLSRKKCDWYADMIRKKGKVKAECYDELCSKVNHHCGCEL